jgi:hypothetical protein
MCSPFLSRAALVCVLFAAASASAADDPMERARQAHANGTAAFQLGKYEEAAKLFEDAYRLSRFPGQLMAAAHSYRRSFETTKNLEHGQRAVELYRAFLSEAQASAGMRPIAKSLMAQIEQSLAQERVRQRADQILKASGRAGLFIADQLIAEGDLKTAATVIDRVLAASGNPRDVVIEGNEKRALVAGSLGERERAIECFKIALTLDPSFAVPDGAAAATVESYRAAKSALGGTHPLAISHVPVAQVQRSRALDLQVTVDSDPLHIIDGFVVRYRAGSGAFSSTRAGVRTPLSIPASFMQALSGGTRVEYVVAAVDERDGELAVLGSEKEPFVALVRPEAGELTAVAGAPRKPWYKKGWVWGVLVGTAAVVAGAGVGIYYAVPQATLPSRQIPTQ